MRSTAAATVGLAALATWACDNRQAFHAPDPSLARMLEQRRADPFAPSSVFADGKVMRSPPPGAIDHEDDEDPLAAPPAVTRALLAEGRVHFETLCATCHGISGDGRSVVASKMSIRPPPSLHEARLRALAEPQLFAVVSDGYGFMPGHSDRLDREARWSVVFYVRALQLSQHAPVAELPRPLREELEREAR